MLVQVFMACLMIGTLLIVPNWDYSQHDEVMARVQAEHFLAYRKAVVSWAQANPGSTGTVADASLPLPPGFSNASGWVNNTQAGVVYVYGAPSRAVGDVLFATCGRSPLVGMKQGGQLVTAQGAITALPAWIPDGNMVGIWVE